MELKQKTEQLERRAAELRAAEEKRHQEELMALKKTNAQLKVCYVLFLAFSVHEIGPSAGLYQKIYSKPV